MSDFQRIFDEIAASSTEREQEHRFDHEAVDTLRAVGFFRIRIPKENGGLGQSLPEAFDLLVGLAAADSNLAQGLRPHYLAVENLRSLAEPAYRERWLTRIAAENLVVGNALTEKNNKIGELNTKLVDGLLNGTKFYSTGALYSDIIQVRAQTEDGGDVFLFVDRAAEGVELVDDWDGFGQQLTASGTTHFRDVRVADDAVEKRNYTGLSTAPLHAQAHHLASLTGIAAAVERDAVAYVQGRTRSFSHANADLPRDDVQVQHVVGQLATSAYAARQVLFGLVRELEQAESPEQINDASLSAYKAQQAIAPLVLEAATNLFEVGGASATSRSRALDRHWRNARVLANHNPIMYRTRIIGDAALNGTPADPQYEVGQR